LEFDGQNQTEVRVGWSKIDFFLILIIKTCIKAILEKYPILKLNKITFALENWKYT